MRIAVWTCAVAAILSATARAGDGRPEGDDPRGPRIAIELIGGGAGAMGGAFAGFAIGVGRGDLDRSSPRTLGIMALGSWLGTSIAGSALGGTGNWGFSLLGSLLGGAGSLALGLTMGSTGPVNCLLFAAMIALPIGGGVLGYEMSQGFQIAPSSAPLRSLHPSFSLSSDGKGALAGLSGTF